MGYKRLLSSSSEGSCTATITKIARLRGAGPGIRFRAQIQYVQLAELKVELDRFFDDVAASKVNSTDFDDENSDSDDESGMIAPERNTRIKCRLQKLNTIYSHMTNQEILGSTTESLLEDGTVRQILNGGSVAFEDTNLEAFAQNLRPYVDSSLKRTPGSRNLYHWPLVRIVHLFVDSPILDHGLVLVDLPGSDNDLNTARSGVAESFKEQLLVTCVVAPAKRAVSDRGANRLCKKHEELRLMMDGNYHSSQLCFVMSQIDDLPLDEFVDQNRNILQEMSAELVEEKELQTRILTLTAHDMSNKRTYDECMNTKSKAKDNPIRQKRIRKDVRGSGNYMIIFYILKWLIFWEH